MSISNIAVEILNDFKKNTGILLPITKFILSNTLLLGLLLVVPFKILFWVYQIGYLSTFGINYDLILRSSFEAQGLWGEMFSSFLVPVSNIVWFFLIIFSLASVLGVFYSNYLLRKRQKRLYRGDWPSLCKYLRVGNLKTFKPIKKVFSKLPMTEIKRNKLLRRIVLIGEIGKSKGKKIFFFAATSYYMSVIFLAGVLIFLMAIMFIHDKGKERAELRLNDFLDHDICNDGWGQSGCYQIKKDKKTFKGYIVAMNSDSIYLVTNKELLILPRDKNVIISRVFLHKSKNQSLENDRND